MDCINFLIKKLIFKYLMLLLWLLKPYKYKK